MKLAGRILSLIAIIWALTFVWAMPALACDMTLTPDQTSVSAGETVVFTLERLQTHRTCSVPLEATEIDVSGGSLVDPGVWQTGTPDILVFTVQFDQEGTGTVTVTRTCDKTPNLTVSSSVEVAAAPAPAAASTEPIAEPDDTAATDAEEVKSGNKNGSNSKTTADATISDIAASASLDVPAAAAAESEPSSAVVKDTSSSTASSSQNDNYSWLPAWLLIDSNWAWWTGFLVLALGLHLLRLEPFRRPLLVVSLIVLGFYLGACPCPMGSVFKLFVQSVSVVLLLVLGLSLIWGRFFCGWLCPMGALQAFFRARGLNWKVPDKADRILKALKYVVLAGFILATAWTGVNAWVDFDPFKALFNFNWAMPATIILIVVLAGNLIIERFFCRYLCPLGAVLAIINRVRALFGRKSEVNNCTGCQKCAKQGCPTGALQIIGEGKEARAVIDSAECISCRSCQAACSKECIVIQ